MLRHVCERSNRTKGLRQHRLKTITWQEDCALLGIMTRKGFLSASRIRVQLIRLIIRHVLSIWSFNSSWGSFKTPRSMSQTDFWLIITATAACWQTGSRTGTISTGWSHMIFDDVSRESLNLSGRRACDFLLSLKCNNPTVSPLADAMIHQQIAYETSADGCSSGACVPTSCGGGDDRASVWGISLDALSEIQLLLNIFEPCGQRHGIRFVWPEPPWFWTLRENTFSSWYGEGNDLFLWSSSIDDHVAIG